MYSELEFNDTLTVFGSEKVLKRINYFTKYLAAFKTKFPTIILKESLEDCSIVYALEYFKNANNFVKNFLDEINFSNRYKIASSALFTIISLELISHNTYLSREINLRFAKFVCYHTIFAFDENHFDIFESYLNSNVEIVNDKFNNIQEHHNFYLNNFSFEERNYLPIMLYALFLQTFIQWIEFKDPKAIEGLQL